MVATATEAARGSIVRAAYYETIGEPEQVLQVGEQPMPAPKDGEMVIRVRVAGVGYWDVKQMRGVFGAKLPFPVIPGYEAAGVVEQGSGDLGPGDAVVASLRFPGGALAEHTAVRATRVVRKPPALSDADAAALVVGAGTALEGLEDRAGVKPGETVLVTAAAGGVGTAGVQIARALGARVLAVASAATRERIEDLGAAHVFDYHDPDWTGQLRGAAPEGADVLLDTAGGDTGERAITAVRPGGRALLIAGVPETIPPGVEAIEYSSDTTAARLHRLYELASAGQLRAVVDRTYPLAHARAALERVAARHAHGKVLVTLE
jgi:NADPH:quinone reductase-like Zn-dependent oxidoreductase